MPTAYGKYTVLNEHRAVRCCGIENTELKVLISQSVLSVPQRRTALCLQSDVVMAKLILLVLYIDEH